MNRHHKIIFSAGLLVAIVLATPVAAHASPLLSGYGGPGQGSQMILGSSLLGGPGGGSGGRAAAAGEASTAASNGGLGSAPAGSTSGSASGSSVSVVHTAHGTVIRQRSSSSGAPAGTSGGAPGSYAALARQAAPPALGVSQDDLLYILLALAMLAVAGALTRRFTYPRGGPARGAE
jgi:hypothetical protein